MLLANLRSIQFTWTITSLRLAYSKRYEIYAVAHVALLAYYKYELQYCMKPEIYKGSIPNCKVLNWKDKKAQGLQLWYLQAFYGKGGIRLSLTRYGCRSQT